MYLKMAKRLLLETDKRLLWKLAWNMGWKGMRSIQKHKSRMKRGEFFPPFLYVSIINSCNLRCQGCWVDVAAKQQKIDVAAMDRMIHEAKAMGNSFFGILGGEPFMMVKFAPVASSLVRSCSGQFHRPTPKPMKNGCGSRAAAYS